MTEETPATRCVNAPITHAAYLALWDKQVHGKGNPPCLRDDCAHCADLNVLIDRFGDECAARGCTMLVCIYDTQ